MRSLFHIDPHHNAAIREEIGARLRIILRLSPPRKVPGKIRRPLGGLIQQDRRIETPRISQPKNAGWLSRLFGRQ